MNDKNHSEIGNAMNFILRPMLAAFVQKKLAQRFGAENWWRLGVLDGLYDEQKRFLPRTGTYEELTDSLDVSLCLLLIKIHWREIFSLTLPRNYLSYTEELRNTRNLWAHEPESFDDATTIRALDTMALISEAFDEEATEKLRAMWNARLQPQKIIEQPKNFSPTGALKSWRDVMEPHPDVARGLYRQAEFAADLGQVVRGEGSSEYTDPTEFFSRTYLTGGLKILLVETLKRLTSGAGEPVIQLKTSFGGGKTHSLLALYHLFGGKIRAEQSSAVREILDAAEISFLPKVHTAVIVGTWENPLGKTLWGEIAAQLSRSTGKPELYEMMRANDEKKISPGVELLKKLFDEAGACLILIDELVAYGRKLSLDKTKSGGTFGNLLSFIQELTEAAKAGKKSSVVVSIPESDAEVGDELGRKVLNQVEKVVGRVEFVWTPIGVEEGYEIVRRRLFKPCRDERAREKVCAAFFNLYVTGENDFPRESRQNTYREKLLACYPIHPKLFDFLYDKWTSLEKFQKTRGVLRLMANVIYHLWTNGDTSPLIMPGNIPINFSPVRDELAKLLGGNWDAIINAEVDGTHSKPHELDLQNVRFGRISAARKISRTIFMGTAPGSRQGDVRGVDEKEICLSVLEPQEIENISVFNDALAKLKTNLYYLYSQDTRLWFGANPTLRKLVDDKREQFSEDDLEFEIEERLKTWRGKNSFKAVNICPKNSAEVPDEQNARLVILSPKYFYVEGQKNNAAVETAKNFLDSRGTVPRRWRNMLVFMAAEFEKLRVLKDNVRNFLAWRSVNAEARHLNLDSLQLEDAKNNLKLAAENFAMKTSQAYCKIFAPELSDDGDLNRPMQVEKIDCTKEENISVASEKFLASEMLLESLGYETLRRLLDKFIWRTDDAVKIGRLWEYFATYYYLPRLTDSKVLLATIQKGVAAKIFGVAEDFQDGKFFGLKFGVSDAEISFENFLVKAEAAEKFFTSPKQPEKNFPPEKISPKTTIKIEPPPEVKPLPKKFSMDAELYSVRAPVQLKKYLDEIAVYLTDLTDSEISIHVAIKISVPGGIDQELQETVAESCRDFGINADHFRFEE